MLRDANDSDATKRRNIFHRLSRMLLKLRWKYKVKRRKSDKERHV